MILRYLLVMALLGMTQACTPILVQTTGEEGIQEDPRKRSMGTVVEDQSVETRVEVNMKTRQNAFRDTSFSVFSHNGIVLLVGQVPTQELKEQATQIAADTSTHIRRIHNELEIGENRGFMTLTGDTWLATKVRTQLAANDEVDASSMRVIANNGVIYLMGILDESEGDRAANLARNVGGVSRVVKVFEYL